MLELMNIWLFCEEKNYSSDESIIKIAVDKYSVEELIDLFDQLFQL